MRADARRPEHDHVLKRRRGGHGGDTVDWEVGNWPGQLSIRDNVGAWHNEGRADLDASERDSSRVSSATSTGGR